MVLQLIGQVSVFKWGYFLASYFDLWQPLTLIRIYMENHLIPRVTDSNRSLSNANLMAEN